MKLWPRRRRGNRPELPFTTGLEDALARAKAAPVRAYTKSGRVAHLLGPDGIALCPNMAGIEWAVWFGAKDDSPDEEKARAAALPACRACERAAGEAGS